MPYAIMGFVVLLGLGGWKLYDYAYDAGWNANKADVLEAKNDELADLNRQNEELESKLAGERKEHLDFGVKLEADYKRKLANVNTKKDKSVADLNAAYQLQLFQASGGGKDKSYTQDGRPTSFISGLAGTEGACLAPKTRYDLEQLSLDGDEAIVLLGLCAAQAIADREK